MFFGSKFEALILCFMQVPFTRAGSIHWKARYNFQIWLFCIKKGPTNDIYGFAWPKIQIFFYQHFLERNCFGPYNFSEPKSFPDQNFFNPISFTLISVEPNCFWTQHFLGPTVFCTQNIFWSCTQNYSLTTFFSDQIFLRPCFFYPKFFWPNFCLTNFFVDLKFVWKQKNFGSKVLVPQFFVDQQLDFQLGKKFLPFIPFSKIFSTKLSEIFFVFKSL